MRYTRQFAKTSTQEPANITSPSHRLLIRAGYVRPLSQGLFSLTPIGMRVIQNIKRIIHQEMEALGGQEVLVPIVNPRELWVKSGRDSLIEDDMIRFHDRAGRDLVLAPTHEEAIVELARSAVKSYRDLPAFLYQFQTKFRDEERPRCGMVRAREFIMKDAYSFHRSFADLNNFFPKVFAAYRRVFDRCRVPVTPAEAGVGYMGGERSYEFLMRSGCGDDHLVSCDACGYAANDDVAVGTKEPTHDSPRPLKHVTVPHQESVSSAASYFEIPRNQLLKSMVFRSGEALVMAVVRGDYEVSREKLARVVGKPIHGRAGPAQLQRFGLLGPWASPVGIPAMARGGITIAVDDAAADSTNFFSATNEPGVVAHNVNFGRDFGADLVADIVRIPAGSGCIHCGEGTLIRERAMELGNIFRLGDYYSKRMNLRVRRDGGRTIYPQMGSYGIGVGRLMTAIVDANRDERGIVWPMEVAPYHVFLMSIGKSLSVRELLEQLYDELGDGVLLDDRHASISHKLKDADLLGIPLRVVVSRDSLSTGTVELALRDQASTYRVQQDELVATVRSMIQERADV